MPPEARYPILYESLRFRRPFPCRAPIRAIRQEPDAAGTFLKALMTHRTGRAASHAKPYAPLNRARSTLRFTVRYPWFERRRGKGSPFLERFPLPSQKSFSALSFQSEFEQALDEIREGHAFDGGFAGNEAGGGHARRGVDFKDVQVPSS